MAYRFYKILENHGGSYDQTTDHHNNNMGGYTSGSIAPKSYRSLESDEEQFRSPQSKAKSLIDNIIQSFDGKESLDKSDIRKIKTILEQIKRQI